MCNIKEIRRQAETPRLFGVRSHQSSMPTTTSKLPLGLYKSIIYYKGCFCLFRALYTPYCCIYSNPYTFRTEPNPTQTSRPKEAWNLPTATEHITFTFRAGGTRNGSKPLLLNDESVSVLCVDAQSDVFH